MLGNLKRKLITQLQPDTDYSFVLMSWANSAGGLQQQVSIRTAPDLLKMRPTQEQHDMDEGGRITLSLPGVPTGVAVRSVYTSTCCGPGGRGGCPLTEGVGSSTSSPPLCLWAGDFIINCSQWGEQLFAWQQPPVVSKWVK